MKRLLLLCVLLAGCTDQLTLADAQPYQACQQDSDCVLDTLSCSGCGETVAVARDRQVAFDQLRGCWPPQGPFGSSSKCAVLEACPPVCSAARCSDASNSCLFNPGDGTTFSTGTSGGFGGSTSATTGGGTVGGTSGSVGSGSGSTT